MLYGSPSIMASTPFFFLLPSLPFQHSLNRSVESDTQERLYPRARRGIWQIPIEACLPTILELEWSVAEERGS